MDLVRGNCVAELRAKATEHRRMAETTRVLKIRAALTKLADRFDALADEREQKENSGGADRDE
jgi:hypothetical protein